MQMFSYDEYANICISAKVFLELEQILVLILNHIRSTVDWIGTGLFF